jgi:hypothetical protein
VGDVPWIGRSTFGGGETGRINGGLVSSTALGVGEQRSIRIPQLTETVMDVDLLVGVLVDYWSVVTYGLVGVPRWRCQTWSGSS